MNWQPANYDEDIDNYAFLTTCTQRAAFQRPKLRSHCPNPVLIHRVSAHAQLRAAQRGLSSEDLAYILCYGQRYHAADAIFYLLLGKDIPKNDRHKMNRLIGTAIVVDKTQSTIITVWRNRQNGMRNIRRKLAMA